MLLNINICSVKVLKYDLLVRLEEWYNNKISYLVRILFALAKRELVVQMTVELRNLILSSKKSCFCHT